MSNPWDGVERLGTESNLLLILEDRLTKQDQMLHDLVDMVKTHIKDEADLTPVVTELVDAWKAAGFLVNIIKWIGMVASAISAAFFLLKGTKS